jgi:hypothetical protein
MLYWILQTIILSILFIVLVHNLIILLKTNLTVPKVKDLVNSNSQKYEQIYNTLNNNTNLHATSPTNESSISNEYTINDLLPNNNINNGTNMKNELKNFLKSQLDKSECNTDYNNTNNTNNNNEYNNGLGTEIALLDSNSQIDYSEF